MILIIIREKVNWNHTIATLKNWRNTTTISNIGDILFPYVLDTLGPPAGYVSLLIFRMTCIALHPVVALDHHLPYRSID